MNERTKNPSEGIKDLLTSLRRHLLRRRRSSPQDIDELIQEGYLRFHRFEQEQQAPVRDPFAFLVQVVENLHLNRVRHTAHTQRIFSNEPLEDVDHVDMGSSPEEEAEAHELIERIERCLEAANPRTREVLMLHRFEGLSYSEIGERLGISTRAVANHVSKGMFLVDNERSRE